MRKSAGVAAAAALMVFAAQAYYKHHSRQAAPALSSFEQQTLRDAPNSDLTGDVNGIISRANEQSTSIPDVSGTAVSQPGQEQAPLSKARPAPSNALGSDCTDPTTGQVVGPDPSGCQQYPLLPNNSLTPGYPLGSAGVDSMPPLAVLCADHYTASVRNGKKVRDVPESEKTQALQNYKCACGITLDPGNEGNPETGYELDHFISLELGGSNDHRNLWPQPYHPAGGQLGAHDKDDVEDYLKSQMCSGKMTQAEAIQQITTNWVTIYNQIKSK
jgi:hypothetical protein